MCLEVQKAVKELRDFNHSPDLSSSQESVFGVFKTLACLVLSNTLAEKFLPKDGAIFASQMCPTPFSPSDTEGHRARERLWRELIK